MSKILNGLDVTGAATISGDLSVGGIGSLVFARKTIDKSISNQATPQNDTDFAFSVVANGVYTVHGLLMYNGGANVGNFTTKWSAPLGATMDWNNQGQPTGASAVAGTVVTNQKSITDQSSLGTIGTASNQMMTAILNGLLIMSSTAGTLQFQWAQAASNATAVTLKAPTWMTLRRVA